MLVFVRLGRGRGAALHLLLHLLHAGLARVEVRLYRSQRPLGVGEGGRRSRRRPGRSGLADLGCVSGQGAKERITAVPLTGGSPLISPIVSGDYAAFVEKRAPDAAAAGPIVDAAGRQLGTHGGIHRFTVGQRKGLGVSSPAPLFVLRIEPSSRTVVVGDRAALDQTALTASGVNWVSIDAPQDWTQAAPGCLPYTGANEDRLRPS
ncbi:MAG: tRNA methyl transferase PRC-barrel domain-containing protein [Vicinamibacterales bacterium]